jgi:hypothetical protein
LRIEPLNVTGDDHPKENPVLPRQGFSLKFLRFDAFPSRETVSTPHQVRARLSLGNALMEAVMDEGFPQHTVGFMRRKREKEQQDERGEKPSQS